MRTTPPARKQSGEILGKLTDEAIVAASQDMGVFTLSAGGQRSLLRGAGFMRAASRLPQERALR